MKKKGFTLVELLAVIAILAILVIIALPNIMNLFNEAKRNSFTNELKELFKTAENQWMTDSMINTTEKYYSRGTTDKCDGTNANSTLQLSGRTQLSYGITVNKAGNIVDFVATDGTYVYQFSGSATAPLKIEDIGKNTGSDTAVTNTDAVISLAKYNKTDAAVKCASKNFTIQFTPAA